MKFIVLVGSLLVFACQNTEHQIHNREPHTLFVPDAAYIQDLDCLLSVWRLPQVATYQRKVWDQPNGSYMSKLFGPNRTIMSVSLGSNKGRGWYITFEGNVGVQILTPKHISQGEFQRIKRFNKLFKDMNFQVHYQNLPATIDRLDRLSDFVVRNKKGEPVGRFRLNDNGYLRHIIWARNLVSMTSTDVRPSAVTLQLCFPNDRYR